MATTRRAGSRPVMGFLARVRPPSHAFLCRCPPARPPALAHGPCVVGRHALSLRQKLAKAIAAAALNLCRLAPLVARGSIDLPRYTLERPPIESRRSLLHCDCLSTTLLFSCAAPLESPFTLGPGLFCFFRSHFRLSPVVLSCTASPPIPSTSHAPRRRTSSLAPLHPPVRGPRPQPFPTSLAQCTV